MCFSASFCIFSVLDMLFDIVCFSTLVLMKIHNNTEKPMREEIWCLQKIGYVVAGFRISSHIVRFSWFLFLKDSFLKTKSIKGKYFKLRVKLTKSYTVCIMCVCYMQFGGAHQCRLNSCEIRIYFHNFVERERKFHH